MEEEGRVGGSPWVGLGTMGYGSSSFMLGYSDLGGVGFNLVVRVYRVNQPSPHTLGTHLLHGNITSPCIITYKLYNTPDFTPPPCVLVFGGAQQYPGTL